MNRKGTEKPIEIFVALFIILAVALVMLKLFQSQIADKQKELADVQQEQKSKELLQKVKQACSDKCVDASNNGCSDASLASLCSYGSAQVLGKNNYIDLNKDQVSGYDTSLLAGIGVCEDRVYCFHLVDSCCAQAINAQNCKAILTRYWDNQGFDDDEIESMLNTESENSIVYAGSCDDEGTMWDELASWS